MEFEDVRVTYRTRRGPVAALAGLDLSVPEGGVFGFLGANGAGKTTAIRAAVGPAARRRGHDPRARCRRARATCVTRSTGSAHSSSSRRSSRTSPAGGTSSCSPARRGIGTRPCRDVLDQVGLGDRADSPFRDVLARHETTARIAAALLKDPELLILDEPANGLDPPGMIEVRTLMRALAAEGRTVFVSSHILSEVEHTCDRVAIVARGRCIAAGERRALARDKSRYRVRAADAPANERHASGGLECPADDDGRSSSTSRRRAAPESLVRSPRPGSTSPSSQR